jgi:hypothetical protein
MIAALQVQSSPPNTAAYYHAAYTWAAVLYALYAISLWRRARRVRVKLATIRRSDYTAPSDT